MSNPRVVFNVEVENVANGGVKVVDKEGIEQVIPFDTLILPRRFGEGKANNSLLIGIKDKVAEVHRIGDCVKVKTSIKRSGVPTRWPGGLKQLREISNDIVLRLSENTFGN